MGQVQSKKENELLEIFMNDYIDVYIDENYEENFETMCEGETEEEIWRFLHDEVAPALIKDLIANFPNNGRMDCLSDEMLEISDPLLKIFAVASVNIVLTSSQPQKDLEEWRSLGKKYNHFCDVLC